MEPLRSHIYWISAFAGIQKKLFPEFSCLKLQMGFYNDFYRFGAIQDKLKSLGNIPQWQAMGDQVVNLDRT